MDVYRRAHDEPCLFFNNSDRIDTVEFMDALPNAPTLGIWCVVYPSENDPIKYPNNSIGTLRRTPFPFTGRKSPAGLGFAHICGTVDEFAFGAVYDPLAPPRPVGANGLPICCNPPPLIGGGGGVAGLAEYVAHRGLTRPGGAGAGGRAFYSAVTYIDSAAGGLELGGAAGDVLLTVDSAAGGMELGGAAGDVLLTVDPAAGGMELGGEAGDVFPFIDPAAGGMEIGGAAGDDYTPGAPTPGTNCASAPLINVGTLYSYPVPSSGVENWFACVAPSSGAMHVTTTGVDTLSFTLRVRESGSCPLPPFVTFTHFGPPCYGWTAVGGETVWLQFGPSAGSGTYTFKVDTGVC